MTIKFMPISVNNEEYLQDVLLSVDMAVQYEEEQEVNALRENIADLNASIAHIEQNALVNVNPIIRMRLLGQKQKLEAERDLKQEQLEIALAAS